MLMAITVEGGGDAEVAAAGGAEVEGAAPGGAEIDFDAEPDAYWEPFDPELAPAPGGTEPEVTWHMPEQVMEIAPGVTQQVWTFDGQVPGPTLRGKLGDIFTVKIVNDVAALGREHV